MDLIKNMKISIYEELDEKEHRPLHRVYFNDEGQIQAIFVDCFTGRIDGMVSVDVDMFSIHFSSEFIRLQEIVDQLVADPEFKTGSYEERYVKK